jgi:hypothetical protein
LNLDKKILLVTFVVCSICLYAALATQCYEQKCSDSEEEMQLLAAEESFVSQALLDHQLWELSREAGKEYGKCARTYRLQHLLEQGANPLVQCNSCTQTTAIEHAFATKDLQMLTLLFQYPGVVNHAASRRTLLHRAKEDHDQIMIDFLLSHGAIPVDDEPVKKPLSLSENLRSKLMRMLRVLKHGRSTKKPELGAYTAMDEQLK